ncbi:4'-phosphopantetheinyl transferase superfamily protein [Parashewanella spongiae]|uniref:4'-phosphopantetheinyl transferase superfamily protein n=1 Tax=Parashewanella spongiae TaxID=342950 RepID=A0A3A6U0E4_9GAMM|nr:4'-phosphopantetheinyl transferase superfamily protein [Parashewanella spongiae]MCL1078845.1 4'-phosphopantetheinyl transferase superfamily protein [Parashewanella spongiae]RJY18796.1 4'-phosphopantetheinyl transferase superfamily protein [Parashewanella spongiae]
MSPLALYFVPFNTLTKKESIQLRGIISDDEVERVERYIGEKQQQQSLFVRAGLRILLSNYAKEHLIGVIEPQYWVFTKGKYGKPKLTDELFNQTKIEFNLSHSGDWLLVGIIHHTQPINEINSEFCLGVDVERDRKNTKIHSILNRYFAKSEVVDLLALPSEALQRERFFDLWACKESYIKATGKGLSTPLGSFSFDLKDTALVSTNVIGDKSETTCDFQLALSEKLKLTHNPNDIHSYWNSYLGRIDSTYRFAVTYNKIKTKISFKLHKLECLFKFTSDVC